MFLDGFDERRQVADIALDHGNVGGAEFMRQEILARRDVVKDHVVAAFDRMLRERCADQT